MSGMNNGMANIVNSIVALPVRSLKSTRSESPMQRFNPNELSTHFIADFQREQFRSHQFFDFRQSHLESLERLIKLTSWSD